MLCAPAIAGAQALQAPEVGIAELSGMGELLTLAVGTGFADLGSDFGLVGDNAVVHPCAAGEHAHERRSAQETCKQLLHGYLLHKKFTTI